MRFDAANCTATAYFTVQGDPVTLSLSPADSTGKNYTLTYSDLKTGLSNTVSVAFPFDLNTASVSGAASSRSLRPEVLKFTPWGCAALEVGGIVLGAAAVLAAVLAVPVAASMVLVDAAAYLSGMGIATAGVGLLAVCSDVLHAVGC